jgi:hypothetical protein
VQPNMGRVHGPRSASSSSTKSNGTFLPFFRATNRASGSRLIER